MVEYSDFNHSDYGRLHLDRLIVYRPCDSVSPRLIIHFSIAQEDFIQRHKSVGTHFCSSVECFNCIFIICQAKINLAL